MIYQILALFIWSSAFVAAKYTFTMMDTILMIQARLFMAAIIVMPLFFVVGKACLNLCENSFGG